MTRRSSRIVLALLAAATRAASACVNGPSGDGGTGSGDAGASDHVSCLDASNSLCTDERAERPPSCVSGQSLVTACPTGAFGHCVRPDERTTYFYRPWTTANAMGYCHAVAGAYMPS